MVEGLVENFLVEAAFLAVVALWPYAYIAYKGGAYRLTFVSCVLGALMLTWLLLQIIALPFAVLFIKVLPELHELGIPIVTPLAEAFGFIAEWHALVVYPVLYLALPILVLRKHEIFRLTSRSNRRGLLRSPRG